MLYISSACLYNESIVDSIKSLILITKNIELSGGTKYDKKLFDRIIRLKKENSLNFLVHSYFPPPNDDFVLNFADTSKKTKIFIQESMKYVSKLEIPYYSIHAGFKKRFMIKDELLVDGKEQFVIENITENIKWYHTEYSQLLALENLFPNGQNDTCFLSHIDEIIDFLDNNKNIYLLLDLGHLKISAKYYNFNYLDAANKLFNNYSDKILEIHLSENDSLSDQHKIILSDSIQYMIIEKFRHKIIKYNINLVIEARGYNLSELEICYKLINKIIGIEQ